MFSKYFLLGVLLAFLSSAYAIEVEEVSIRASPRPSADATPVAGDVLKAYLSKPTGMGPFGAVIALHGCGGMSERFKQEMTSRYTAWGYVTLVVDSFANHNVKFACGNARSTSRADERPWDAVGAMQYLATLPFVDPHRIALLGSSQGSWVALEVAQTRSTSIFHNPQGVKPRAVVAYYPDCRSTFDSFDVPVLIMVGGLDDWTPAIRCQAMMERRAGRGAPVELTVYPDARHAFDWIDLQPARRVAGYIMEYHEESALRSMELHRKFLATHIGSHTP